MYWLTAGLRRGDCALKGLEGAMASMYCLVNWIANHSLLRVIGSFDGLRIPMSLNELGRKRQVRSLMGIEELENSSIARCRQGGLSQMVGEIDVRMSEGRTYKVRAYKNIRARCVESS